MYFVCCDEDAQLQEWLVETTENPAGDEVVASS